MTMSNSSAAEIDQLVSMVVSYEKLDPDFISELDMLNITIDEYERILADNEPRVITSDNTVR